MKLTNLIILVTIAFLQLFPNGLAFTSKFRKVQTVDEQQPNIVIPDSMKESVNQEETITFPEPKRSAFLLMSLFSDMDQWKCPEGVDNALQVKKLVLDFIATVKPNQKSTPEEVKERQDNLERSLLAIRDSFASVYNSATCSAFLKAEAKRFRRVVFLLSLR